jgi:hypothetical protein
VLGLSVDAAAKTARKAHLSLAVSDANASRHARVRNNWIVVSQNPAAGTSTRALTIKASALTAGEAAAVNASNVANGSVLAGFGAPDSIWEARHTADTRFAPGSAYDPSPDHADPSDPSRNDRYYTVGHTDGRVTMYSMRNPPGTSIAAAQADALAEFPADATTLWFSQKDVCAATATQSPMIGAALGDPKNREGRVLVAFYTLEAGGESAYRPENVNEMVFLPIHVANPDEAPSC